MDISFSEYKGHRDLHLDSFCCFSSGGKVFFIIVDGFGDSKPEEIMTSIQKISSAILEKENHDIMRVDFDSCLEKNIKMAFMGVVFYDSYVEIFSAGDCRIYNNGKLISSDDTVAWKALIKRNGQEEAALKSTCHPMRHRLTNCLSKGRKAELNRARFPIIRNKKFLLCTDGVWSVFHKEIALNEFDVGMIQGNLRDNGLVIEIVL